MRLVRNCAFVRQLADRTRAVIVGPVLQEPALESTKGHCHRRPNVVGVPFSPEKVRWKAPPRRTHSPSGTSQTHLCLRAAYPWFTLIEVHAKGCSKITGWFSRSQRQKSSKTAGYLFVMPVAATCPVRERTRPRVSLSTEVAPSGKTLVLACVVGMGVWETNERQHTR